MNLSGGSVKGFLQYMQTGTSPELWYSGAVAGGSFIGGTPVTTSDKIFLSPYPLEKKIVIDRVRVSVQAPADPGSAMRVGLYSIESNNNVLPLTLVQDFGEIGIDSAGYKTIVVSDLVLPPGLYWLANICSLSGATLPTVDSIPREMRPNILGIKDNGGFMEINTMCTYLQAYGALPASLTPASIVIETGVDIAIYTRLKS